MKALVDPNCCAELPALMKWLEHAEATRRILRFKYADLDGRARLETAIQENVLVQLEHVRTQPAVAAALARRAVHLHGWIYRIETGEVFAYDPNTGQFEPIVGAPRGAQEPARLAP
jgi:carbonic anhydrase